MRKSNELAHEAKITVVGRECHNHAKETSKKIKSKSGSCRKNELFRKANMRIKEKRQQRAFRKLRIWAFGPKPTVLGNIQGRQCRQHILKTQTGLCPEIGTFRRAKLRARRKP